MEQKQTMQIKIYRDGNISRFETYAPVVKRKVLNGLYAFDYWIGHSGQWPPKPCQDDDMSV